MTAVTVNTTGKNLQEQLLMDSNVNNIVNSSTTNNNEEETESISASYRNSDNHSDNFLTIETNKEEEE